MSASILPVIVLIGIVFLNPSNDHASKPKAINQKPNVKSLKKDSQSQHIKSPRQKEKANDLPVKSVELEGSSMNDAKEYRSIFEFITNRFKKVSTSDAEKIAKYLVKYGKEHGIDPKFAAAVIARESAFNKQAESKTGAKGLGQIKDFNFPDLNINDPYDIRQNVSGTTNYLKKMLNYWKVHSKKTSLALASYYKGPNAVRRMKGDVDTETENYVKDIMKYYDDIKRVRVKYGQL